MTLGGLEHFMPPVIPFLFFLMVKNFSQNPDFFFLFLSPGNRSLSVSRQEETFGASLLLVVKLFSLW